MDGAISPSGFEIETPEAEFPKNFLSIEYRLDDHAAGKPKITGEFHTQMLKIARRMAMIEIDSKRFLNEPLFDVLIDAFERGVDYEVVETKTPINERSRNLVFVLAAQGESSILEDLPEPEIEDESPAPGFFNSLLAVQAARHPQKKKSKKKEKKILSSELPHNDRVVLWRGDDGELYVPCLDRLVPFELNIWNMKKVGGPIGRKIVSAYYEGLKNLENPKNLIPTRKRRIDAIDAENIKEATAFLEVTATPYLRKAPVSGPMAPPIKIVPREKPLTPPPAPRPVTRAMLVQQIGEVAVALTEWNRLQSVADGVRPRLDQHKAHLLAQHPDVEPNPKAKGIAREFSQMHRLFRKIGKRVVGAEDALNRWAKRQRKADKERRALDKHVTRMQALLTQTKSPDPKIVRQLSRMQQAIGKYAAASQEVLAESVENAWARLANHGPEIQDDAGDVSTLPLDRPRQTATTSAQLNARAKLLAIKQADRQFRHNRALHHS